MPMNFLFESAISVLASELDGKRQEILIEAVPGLRRMAALADSNTTTSPQLSSSPGRGTRAKVSIFRFIGPPDPRRLRQPLIGALTASAVVAAIENGAAFTKGRDFGAWLGLVPKQLFFAIRQVFAQSNC